MNKFNGPRVTGLICDVKVVRFRMNHKVRGCFIYICKMFLIYVAKDWDFNVGKKLMMFIKVQICIRTRVTNGKLLLKVQ